MVRDINQYVTERSIDLTRSNSLVGSNKTIELHDWRSCVLMPSGRQNTSSNERSYKVLNFTDSAAAHLFDMKKDAPAGQTLRLYKDGNKLGLKWDIEKPEDRVVSHATTTVLVYEPKLGELLSDKSIDVKPTDKGPVLALA